MPHHAGDRESDNIVGRNARATDADKERARRARNKARQDQIIRGVVRSLEAYFLFFYSFNQASSDGS
jgi:hypothetical protein